MASTKGHLMTGILVELSQSPNKNRTKIRDTRGRSSTQAAYLFPDTLRGMIGEEKRIIAVTSCNLINLHDQKTLLCQGFFDWNLLTESLFSSLENFLDAEHVAKEVDTECTLIECCKCWNIMECITWNRPQ